MLKKNIADELNQQLNRELHSSYIYLGMAVYCDSRSLDGFAHWLQLQAKEEFSHAMKIYGYLKDMAAEVTLYEVPKAAVKFASLTEVFEKTAEHERFITESLNKIATMALEEKDLVTYAFLDWFLKEQIEEMATAAGILEKVKLVGDSGTGVYALNAELGRRA